MSMKLGGAVVAWVAVAGWGAAAVAQGDHGHDHGDATRVQGAVANQKFDQLVRRGSDGKVERLDGFVDLIALRMNPQIDAATWEKIVPGIEEWIEDTDRSVIDNLDFVEELDGGVLERLDLMDANNNRRVMEMEMQFLAIGPLTAYLEAKGLLTRGQSQSTTNMVNEHYQQIMNEVRDEAQQAYAALSEEERSNKVIHATSRFIFELMARDAMASYARQLDNLAPNLSRIASQMRLEGAAKATVERAAGSVKNAATPQERRKVVKAALAALPIEQRREMLRRSREMAPRLNPREAYEETVARLRAGR